MNPHQLPETTPDTVAAAARMIYERGWTPVPIRKGTKAPAVSSWPSLQYADADEVEQAFADREGVGVVLGLPSNGLIDVDIDSPEMSSLINHLLPGGWPRTSLETGRPSSPRSHRWYLAEEGTLPERTERIVGESADDLLLEIRSTGGQTVVPPSTHPSGEPYVWEVWGEPAVVNGHYLAAIAHLYAVILVLKRHWVGSLSGSRHVAFMALSGGLLRDPRTGGVDRFWERVGQEIVLGLVEVTQDAEEVDRLRTFNDTIERLRDGDGDGIVTGWTRLGELIGEGPVSSVREHLQAIRALQPYLDPTDGASDERELTSPPSEPALGVDAPEPPIDVSPSTQEPARRTLLDAYPDAPESFRPYFSRTPFTTELPESAWGSGFTADQAIEQQSAPPSIGQREDGVSLFAPGTMSMAFGGPKTGKTWFALAIVRDVVKSGGRALYIDWENGAPELIERFTGMGLDPGERSRILITRPGSTRLPSIGDRWEPGDWGPEDVRLAMLMLDWQPDLVVVDSLSRLLGRHGMGPNDAEGVERIEELVTETLTATGAAVLLIDHTGHATTERAAGSYRKGAMVTGTSIAFERDEDMGKGRHGWSHVRLVEERTGWLRQHVDEDTGNLATLSVDNLNEGRYIVEVKTPQPPETLHIPDPPGGLKAALESTPAPRVPHSPADVVDLLLDVLDGYPEGLPKGKMEDALRIQYPDVTRAEAREGIELAIEDEYLLGVTAPRGTVWRVNLSS